MVGNTDLRNISLFKSAPIIMETTRIIAEIIQALAIIESHFLQLKPLLLIKNQAVHIKKIELPKTPRYLKKFKANTVKSLEE
jgi:hypothetical protein